MSHPLPVLAASVIRHPAILRARPSVNRFLLRYMMKFRPRRVGGHVILHSHLPPLNSRAYGRFVREHLLGGSRGPSHAQIGLTDACPQHCAYCYNKGRQGVAMDAATLRRTISDLKALGVFWLGLTGGEPLLNREIVDLTAVASPDCAVKLFTTGMGLTPALADDLRRAGLFSVSVSLDHGTAEKHDAIRGYPGAFNAAMRAIGMFKEAGLHTGVSAVLSTGMIRSDGVEPFLEFLNGLGLDEAWLSEMKPSLQGPSDPAAIATAEERRSLIRLQDRWNRSARMTVNYLGHFEAGAHFGCNAGTKMIYVDAFGEVSPCVFAPLSFGNVRQTPLAAIWDDMRSSFAPGEDCFMLRNQGLLRSRAGAGLPIAPSASRELVKEIHPEAPGRFVGLLDRSRRSST
ncbi:MAG: radical SAM protein [Candidatus Aminicenantes bacterium]|nr:radical SAM protein [Candidatus Aminicenantes bacterium]